MKVYIRHSFLSIVMVGAFFFNLVWGSVHISLEELFSTFFGSFTNPTIKYIIFQFRLPKSITALLTGASLSVCGLLMQTLFRNPLAGPYVLGLSSGSSLMVAIVIMGSHLLPLTYIRFIQSTWGISFASFVGSSLILLLVSFLNHRYRDSTVILISGMLFSAFAGAMVSILSYNTSAELLQRYSLWSMGSMTGVSWGEIRIYFLVILTGFCFCLFLLKPLNALLLGKEYAQSLGVDYVRTRWILILVTSLLSGAVTSFVGPVAFVGLAVPHMVRIWYGSVLHSTLLIGCILMGGALMLVCDFLSSGLGELLPINAVTSLVGAPILLYLILKKKTSA